MIKKSGKMKVLFLVSLLVFFVSGSKTYAYDVNSGGFASARNLKYDILSGSDNAIAQNAISKWNNITNNVHITRGSSLNANIVLSCDAVQAPTPSLIGISTHYYNDQQVSPTALRTKTLCIQYKNPKLQTLTNKQATAVHEVGHALSLKDIKEESVLMDNHIMLQGVKNYASLSNYDKNNLIYKWGYYK